MLDLGLKSNRKTKITMIYLILVTLNKKLNLEIPDEVLTHAAYVVIGFLAMQGFVDMKDVGNHHDNHTKEVRP